MLEKIDVNIDYNLFYKTFLELNLLSMLEQQPRQIAVQHRGVELKNQLIDSCGSLKYDWNSYNPKVHLEVPKRLDSLQEEIFTQTCEYFKNTYIETIIEELKKKYIIYRGRFMCMPMKQCLTYHVDKSKRLHIPIITNPDCFMIIEDKLCRLLERNVYIVDTTLRHTAINASNKDRIHLIFCVKEKT